MAANAYRAQRVVGSLFLPATLMLFATHVAVISSAAADDRCFAVEIYYRPGEAESERALQLVEKRFAARRGINLVKVDLQAKPERVARLRQIAEFFRLDPETTPLVYACNRAIQGCSEQGEFERELEQLTRMEVFTRAGCPRCASAKAWLPELAARYPGLEVVYYEVTSDARAREYVQQLARQHGQAAASVPVFHYCRQLTVGWDSSRGTGARIEAVLEKWSYECPAKKSQAENEDSGARNGAWRRRGPSGAEQAWWIVAMPRELLLASVVRVELQPREEAGDEVSSSETRQDAPANLEPEADETALPPLPLPLPLPDGSTDTAGRGELDREAPPTSESLSETEGVPLPVFGRVNAKELGLPVFTIAIGLVDGFNPCAMWVLLFLLSILVNLRSRAKILAVAGTFVLISGLVYFAFMAAWLNVFRWINLLRPVQVALGVLAIGIGLIHVKDFFAFKRGLSLSIPEAAKPGIYARVRRIVTAENLLGAIVGASVLAVMVNFIELLCTAGLPAIYTQILSARALPAWQNYAYLALYNVAYMFDDALMVMAVVITLSKTKMQEHHGRYLKLVSGVFILVLGIVMLVRPEWLEF